MQFARHASRILPGAQSPWAKAMRCELDYIGDDPAALRWAFGCILASCKIRLSHWPWFSARTARRCAAAGAGLVLLSVVSFEGYAAGQTVSAKRCIEAAPHAQIERSPENGLNYRSRKPK
jgi:hypothetical protein